MAIGSPVGKPSLNDSGTFFDANAASQNPSCFPLRSAPFKSIATEKDRGRAFLLPPDPDPDPIPDPEPVVLFQDDFERPDSPTLGKGWQQTDDAGAANVELDGGVMEIKDSEGGTHGIALNYVEIPDATNYESFTVDYRVSTESDPQDGNLVVSYSSTGVAGSYETVATHHINDPALEDPTEFSYTVENDNFDYFVWRFDHYGAGESEVDNVTVTAQPVPVTSEFQGY